MPPQQAYGLLDFVDNNLGFCTHCYDFRLIERRAVRPEAGGP
jgi:hypothetical protein